MSCGACCHSTDEDANTISHVPTSSVSKMKAPTAKDRDQELLAQGEDDLNLPDDNLRLVAASNEKSGASDTDLRQLLKKMDAQASGIMEILNPADAALTESKQNAAVRPKTLQPAGKSA